MTGWRSPLVFALCVCGALAPAAARGEPDYGAEYTACVERAGGNMPAMMECTKAAWARWDKRLNETFKKVTERVGKDRQAQLLAAQRLWVKYRDANCGFYNDPQGGQAAHLEADTCMLRMTAERTNELDAFAQ